MLESLFNKGAAFVQYRFVKQIARNEELQSGSRKQ